MKRHNQPTNRDASKVGRILRSATRFLIVLGQFIKIVKKNK